jgi:7,8-dihydroneopterin aldolase/epimerase/oxygenase
VGIVSLRGIRCYSFHGCLEEEAIIGGNYSVDVNIHSDFSVAVDSDDLNDTVDYCKVYEIVKREMKIRSNLIEHVANRIAIHLKKEIVKIEKVEVTLTKIAAPLNGDVASVAVTVVL